MNRSVEDILGSIRDGVESKGAKKSGDDVLDLGSMAIDEPKKQPPAASTGDIDIDSLMAEVASEVTAPPATPNNDDALAELQKAAAAPPEPEPVVAPLPELPKAPVMVDEPVAHVNGHSAANGSRVQLNAMPSAKGLQVAFPAEVLAEALRPLVASWVAENLPDVVERLVREELTRLAER